MYKSICEGTLRQYNYNSDPTYFTEKEIDYVIKMIQQRAKDFVKENLIKSFYMKSILTLVKLIEYCDLGETRYYSQI